MVQNNGSPGKDKPVGGSRTRDAALLFAAVFSQSLIATIEVVAISKSKAYEAGFWAALNASAYIISAFLIIDSRSRKIMAAAYIAACSIATMAGVVLGKIFC